MDAEQAIRIATDAQRAAARNRAPKWYPPLVGVLWAAGAVVCGASALVNVSPASHVVLLAVGLVAWVAMAVVIVVMTRRGGVLRRPAARSNRERWADSAPSLAAAAITLVVGLTAGAGWMLVSMGLTLGLTEWFRLARLHQ
ncbi:hypothetical protein D5S18_29500 [Nocardia panacis]|uniref:Uncharacterized protein n=1 Tax=Nocardia panacis TaxID=2340916 RepID=A0A3A4KCI1_9NOCA|nr:hypothetical protein [Nocardia panacis]RJO70002.1 hypothetical protein D5S18_29500 [Nocardia panacis]